MITLGKRCTGFTCPIHGLRVERRNGIFGRYVCCPLYPSECDIVLNRGSDDRWRVTTQVERNARKRAHAAFDPLWQSRRMTRTQAYRRLAESLGIPIEQCHIGHFGEEMCDRVVEAAEWL